MIFFEIITDTATDLRKKKPMYKILILQAVISPVSSSPFSKFERYDKNVEKIPLLGTIVVPTIFEIISLFSLFFPFFFFSQIGGRVGDNSKKNHRRFYPPPEVRVSFARDASLEAHIPSPQSSF